MTVYPAALVTRDNDGFSWPVPSEQRGSTRQNAGSASPARASRSGEPVLAGEVLPRTDFFSGSLEEASQNPAIVAYLRNSGSIERMPGAVIDGYA